MQYAELDKRILKVIAERGSPLYNKHVNEEARRLAAATGRDAAAGARDDCAPGNAA
jgi:hypothetical protein